MESTYLDFMDEMAREVTEVWLKYRDALSLKGGDLRDALEFAGCMAEEEPC